MEIDRVVHVIKRAYTVIKRGWTQGCDAQDIHGYGVSANSPFAAKWCLVGAVARAVWDLGETRTTEKQAVRELRKTITGNADILGPRSVSVTSWNDSPNRTQVEVLAVMRRTLKRLRMEENLP